MNEIIMQAISRLTDELEQIKGNRYVECVKNQTAEALMDCCNKSADFAERVVNSEKSLYDCLNAICKGIASSISDAELFNRAVQFYFPEAEIRWNIEIICPASKNAPLTAAQEKPERKVISIFDLDI